MVYQEAEHLFDDDVLSIVDQADATKRLIFSVGGASTGTTLTLTAAHTANRAITFPDVTDTLVGLAASQTLTNKTLTSPVLNGSLSGTAFLDEDNMASNSAVAVPSQQSVKAYVDAQVTAQNLDFQGDSGGALDIDLDSEVLTIAGGTGIDTVGSGNTLTVNIDSTVATLTGSQTLTNKTLTTPIISTISNTGTLTLPTSTDTLVGRATTDTLTNKTLTAPVISTISNTGTLTLPTSTDTLVGRATTDTLTNKTLTSPVLTTPSVTTSLLMDNQAEIRFEESGGGANYVGFKAPASLSADKIWTLPSADGSGGTFLQTDGSGVLTFASAASAAVSVTTKTTTYTALTSDDVILVDTSGGNWTLTLYAAAGNSGKRLKIKKTTSDFNVLTIDGNASETIDGATTQTLINQYESIDIICDGSNWFIEGIQRKGLMETKTLAADFSTNNAEVTDLTFNNLVVGRTYTIQAHIAFNKDSADAQATVVMYNSAATSNVIGYAYLANSNTSTSDFYTTQAVSLSFVAADTVVRFLTGGFAAGTNLFGSGGKGNTYATLIEEPYTKETTRF